MREFLGRSFLRQLSRRDFLKLSGASMLAGLWLPAIGHFSSKGVLKPDQELGIPSNGRITTSDNAFIYDAPSFSANPIRTYWKDLVLPVTGVTLSENLDDYNRVWYQLNNEGYMYSGIVQPVEIISNQPDFNIPPDGRLAEITVPFTDAYKNPEQPENGTQRLYYSTMYWVLNIYQDEEGTYWYLIQDDYFKEDYYYVQAEHVRFLEPAEVAPLSPDVAPEAKRLEVILSTQTVIAYENEEPVFMARAATGARWRLGVYLTPVGRHIIQHKRPQRHMTSNSPASALGYDLPGVPWVSYFTESGVSFHGTFWHNDFGRPRSHGCVNMSPQGSRWVYRWSLPVVPYNEDMNWEETGTIVDVIE
jgi:hypothetical protein